MSQSLDEFNSVLAANHLPTLDEGQFEALQAERPKNQLAKAATRISDDPGARAYITKAMTAIGVVAQPKGQINKHEPHQRPRTRQTVADPRPSSSTPEADCRPDRQTKSRAATVDQAKAGQGDESPFSANIHVYGGKAALCFEPSVTRNGEDLTVTLDAAVALAPRQYDWQNKVRVQFTRSELPVAACVLLGFIPGCEYKNHGAGSDKGFSLENQGQKVFVKVWAKDQGVRAVPVEAPDIYRVTALLIGRLRSATPWMSAESIIQTLKLTVARRIAQSQQNS